MYYQPKARISDGKVIGVEALVRWNHPTHGFVTPDEFIPVAETTGVIQRLTSFVLRTAMGASNQWRSDGMSLDVAVNLAARSLHDLSFPDEIAELLRTCDVAPGTLTLELTESSIMADTARTARVLHSLADLGVKLSIDDFGTGYSSLSHLQRMPVHEIKIDKRFVFSVATNNDDAAIVRSVIDLGHSLGLNVVAEGIEHSASWERLHDMGCDVAQGYFLSPPMPEQQFREWLQSRQGVNPTSATGIVPSLSRG